MTARTKYTDLDTNIVFEVIGEVEIPDGKIFTFGDTQYELVNKSRITANMRRTNGTSE